jgi:hypothetical protein
MSGYNLVKPPGFGRPYLCERQPAYGDVKSAIQIRDSAAIGFPIPVIHRTKLARRYIPQEPACIFLASSLDPDRSGLDVRRQGFPLELARQWNQLRTSGKLAVQG